MPVGIQHDTEGGVQDRLWRKSFRKWYWKVRWPDPSDDLHGDDFLHHMSFFLGTSLRDNGGDGLSSITCRLEMGSGDVKLKRGHEGVGREHDPLRRGTKAPG